MELITGKTGEQHVYAADDAAIYKMMVGSGDYVLPLGNQLAARMNGTTELIVSDGLLITQGRLARTRASSGEDHLQIANGVDGQRRADLIVAEYSQYDSEIEGVSTTLEKMELKVIQGAYSTTEWKTPSHTTGDIDAGRTHQVPLWEVRLDGINFNSLVDHRVFLNPVIDTVQNNITSIQSNLLDMAHDMAAGIKSRISGCYRDTQSGDGTAITSKVFHLTGYQYKSADIFMAYMNGLLMREDEITSIASDGSTYGSDELTGWFGHTATSYTHDFRYTPLDDIAVVAQMYSGSDSPRALGQTNFTYGTAASQTITSQEYSSFSLPVTYDGDRRIVLDASGLSMTDDMLRAEVLYSIDAGNVVLTFASEITMSADDKIELVVLAGGE